MINNLEKSSTAVVGAEQPPQHEAASVFERVIAFLFDFLLLFSLVMWSFVLYIKTTGWVPDMFHINATVIGFWVIFVLYMAVFNCGGRKTLGAALIGIAVVNKDTYQPLGFGKSFMRALGYLVGLITAFTGFALALFNGRGRAVQDLMSGSMVITTREKSTAESAVISAFGTVLIGVCVFSAYYFFFVMPSFFDKTRISNAEDQLMRISFLQIQHKQLFGKYTQDMVRLGLISGDPVQFQRDIQRNLKRRGFSLSVGNDGFAVRGIAKDSKETEVYFTFTEP